MCRIIIVSEFTPTLFQYFLQNWHQANYCRKFFYTSYLNTQISSSQFPVSDFYFANAAPLTKKANNISSKSTENNMLESEITLIIFWEVRVIFNNNYPWVNNPFISL